MKLVLFAQRRERCEGQQNAAVVQINVDGGKVMQLLHRRPRRSMARSRRLMQAGTRPR